MSGTTKQQQAEQELRDRISEATGFDLGDEFALEQQVREYMSIETQRDLYGDNAADAETLEQWANAILENEWHMQQTFALERRAQRAAATGLPYDDPQVEAILQPHDARIDWWHHYAIVGADCVCTGQVSNGGEDDTYYIVGAWEAVISHTDAIEGGWTIEPDEMAAYPPEQDNA